MFGTQDSSMPPVGYLYEFDCKPITTSGNLRSDWTAIMNAHVIAFVQKGDGLAVQVCQGGVPSEDKLTTASGSTSTTVNTTNAATSTTATTTISSNTSKTTKTTPPVPVTASTTKAMPTTMSSRSTLLLTTTIRPTTLSTTTTSRPTTLSTTSKPTSLSTTTAMKSTVKDQGNLSLCPHSVTRATDARWIRQYKNFCYEIVPNRYEDWYDALDDCTNRHGSAGGTLLEIYTSDIQHYIVQFLRDESYTHPVWIGLQDVDMEEHWDHWETDTKLAYENFDPNRKNNFAHHSKEDCVLLEPTGFWDDSVCDERNAQAVEDGHGFIMGRRLVFTHSWICQYPTTKPTTAIPVTSTPVISITGILSLCPNVLRQTVEQKWIRQYKNFCYEIVPLYKDWYEASQYCSSRGSGTNGRIIEIYTSDIQNFITQFLREEAYKHPVWIGLQDVDKEERWDHWDSDIPLAYENFDPNRTNNYANHAQENCVLLEPSGYWDDSVCNEAEANRAEDNGHAGLVYRHSWICQYPIQQNQIFGKRLVI